MSLHFLDGAPCSVAPGSAQHRTPSSSSLHSSLSPHKHFPRFLPRADLSTGQPLQHRCCSDVPHDASMSKPAAPVPMRSPELHIRSRRQLTASGIGKRQLGLLLRDGRMRRIAHGWYATAGAPEEALSALRRGHRLTCISALRLHGIWTPVSPHSHEAALRTGRRTDRGRAVGQGILLHDPPPTAWPVDAPILPLMDALTHALRCLDATGAAIVLESALHLRLITAAEVHEVAAGLSARHRAAIFPLSATAESGTETIVRRFLERRGIAVRPQVLIPGVGHVDMVVGERLVIECDSVAFHAGTEQFHRDRQRDLRLRELGYIPVRLTWEQVVLDWDRTSQVLLAMVRRGDHRAPRTRT